VKRKKDGRKEKGRKEKGRKIERAIYE